MNYGYHLWEGNRRDLSFVQTIYSMELVLGVVLLRCRIFSTKEWRACLDASCVLNVWNEIASPRG